MEGYPRALNHSSIEYLDATSCSSSVNNVGSSPSSLWDWDCSLHHLHNRASHSRPQLSFSLPVTCHPPHRWHCHRLTGGKCVADLCRRLHNLFQQRAVKPVQSLLHQRLAPDHTQLNFNIEGSCGPIPPSFQMEQCKQAIEAR